MAELDIRQWSMAAERRIANAVREIEALRREIRGKRRGTGVTYPNPNRVAHVYGGVAAGTDEAPAAGELKFARINTDTTDYEDEDDEPTTFYNIGPALDDGEAVIANLDIFGKYSDGQKAIWVVGGSEGGADVPSIFVGMSSTASAENDFGTTSTTYNILWSIDETVNSDTAVFGQTNDGSPANTYYDIQCKVAGTYRVWYNCAFDVTTTHTASEIQRARTYIISKVGGVGAQTELPGSSCTCDMLNIDSDDMPVGLGSPRAKSHGETLVTLAANDTLRMQFEYQSGDRGYTGVGESFGAQLVKRS